MAKKKSAAKQQVKADVIRRMETAEPFITSDHAVIVSSHVCPWKWKNAKNVMCIQWGHAYWHPQVFYKSWIDDKGRQWCQWRYVKADEVLPTDGSRMDKLCYSYKEIAYVD